MSDRKGICAPPSATEDANSPIDFSVHFVPEPLTQLFYTPALARLAAVQRLRYNQLYAAHINEQFIFFEHDIGNAISRALLASGARLPPALRERLRVMVDDEERHQGMFEAINRRAFPELYAERRHYFIRPSAFARLLLGAVVRYPQTLSFVLWLAFFLEEASAEFSKTVLKSAKAGATVEPNFLALHARHLRDEVHHVRLYPDLVRAVLAGSSRLARRLNGALLSRLMREFLAPKRSGIAVVDRLVRECPELRGMHRELRREIRALAGSPDFYEAFFAASKLPSLHAMFAEFPEFSWSAVQSAGSRG